MIIRRVGMKFHERLKKEYFAEKVILYGSHVGGEATEDSDVDILVIAPTNQRMFERMATVSKLIRDLRNGFPDFTNCVNPGRI